MRNIYVDEAGTSGAPHEHISMVLALVVHADTQWRPVIEELAHLIHRYVPEPRRHNFTFHAKELFAANKFPDWDYEVRKVFMCEVMSLPRRFHVPIVLGAVRRKRNDWTGWPIKKMSDAEIDHLMAFVCCMGITDYFFRTKCGEEMAQVIAEQVPRIEKHLNRAVSLLRAKPFPIASASDDNAWVLDGETHLRVTRVVDEVHFMHRFMGPFLQIADACVFGLRRRFHEQNFGEEFLESVLGKETTLPGDFAIHAEVYHQDPSPGLAVGQLPADFDASWIYR